MRNTLLLQPKQIKVFISTLILLCCGVLFQNTAWSETNIATATDEADAIVAGKIIQKQQTQAAATKLEGKLLQVLLLKSKLRMIWLMGSQFVVCQL